MRTPPPTSQVERVIIELYNDISKRHSAAIVKVIRDAVINVLYLNVDIWTSKVSGKKFIGESCCLCIYGMAEGSTCITQ